MTSYPQLALVLTGQVRRYPLALLPSLVAHLGPVKGVSFRQASRIANTLRAGFPVKDYGALARARVVLVCAPERQLRTLVEELQEAAVDWRRKVVLVCSGLFDSSRLAALAARGAEVGSMHALEELQPVRFLIEGDRQAVRWARRLVEDSGGVAVEIERGSASLCAAGESLASWLLLALLDGSARCFRRAGLTAGAAGPIVARLAHRAARSYLKGGRRACRVPETQEEQFRFRLQIEALRRADPALAGFVLEVAVLAFQHLERDSGWLRELALERAAGRG
jgi:predicted short-subunit dehydrogenase-like oxidoreductase (DUF2520 family)